MPPLPALLAQLDLPAPRAYLACPNAMPPDALPPDALPTASLCPSGGGRGRDFDRDSGLAPVVALTGAGGKTTLLFALAQTLAAAGLRVITATTTHILPPTPAQSPACLLSPTFSDLRRALCRHHHVTVAGQAVTTGKQRGKLAGLAPEAVADLRHAADVVLVEADGAALRPLKAPAAHEPAVPPCANLCIALCGLGGVGQPLHTGVHRPERAAALCACSSRQAVTPAHLAHLTLHPQGLFRTTPPTALRAVLCIMPQGMPEATGLTLARQAAEEARCRYPQSQARWWAGSAARGEVVLLYTPSLPSSPLGRTHCD